MLEQLVNKNQPPRLFGIRYSNRDFSDPEMWGKNQFNSSFPAALTNFIAHKRLANKYLYIGDRLNVEISSISTEKLYGIAPTSDDLFFAFESVYTPYEQYVIGKLPRIDLVTQSKQVGRCLRPIEIKLTALPDNSTCEFSENKFGCEIVVRPDTILYLACSFVSALQDKREFLRSQISQKFPNNLDWANLAAVCQHIPTMLEAIDMIVHDFRAMQEPFLLQPIWKTNGKLPHLAEFCLDNFVWSNFAFTRLFVDPAKKEIERGFPKTISRQMRSVIWLFRMIDDFLHGKNIDYRKIIDELSFNTKNDKAFAVSGRLTHKYMQCQELLKPRIHQNEIRDIILGGGQNLLSPERRFDAILFHSPELFVGDT